MEKVTQYKVISGCDVKEIERQVNEALNKGWQPCGGLAAAMVAGKSVFTQVIVR
jgi:hypothetical protein